MTTTSYKISQKLFHAGFEAKTDTYVHGERVIQDPKYPAYDLETIIEALPSRIKIGSGYQYLFLDINASLIHYLRPCATDSEMKEFKEPDESWTDAAARLLLKLRLSGIVSFEQDKS